MNHINNDNNNLNNNNNNNIIRNDNDNAQNLISNDFEDDDENQPLDTYFIAEVDLPETEDVRCEHKESEN